MGRLESEKKIKFKGHAATCSTGLQIRSSRLVVSRTENARVGRAESTKVIVCATKRDILSHPRLPYLDNCVNYKTGIA